MMRNLEMTKTKLKGIKLTIVNWLTRSAVFAFNLIFGPQKNSNGELNWASLTGSEYKVLLEEFPKKLFFLIFNKTHEPTARVWREFHSLYR